MSRIRKCPKCRCANLSVLEDHIEHGQTDFGEVRVDERGNVIPPGVFWFEVGGPVRVALECGDCGHSWPARASVSSEIARPEGACDR